MEADGAVAALIEYLGPCLLALLVNSVYRFEEKGCSFISMSAPACSGMFMVEAFT
jgi:hypothetical protein